ncbi:MAG: TonB-dependent receptor [Bacteroidales bacterium]|nr:TonB-dependent receptor [Bacteroidales bacterium]
MNKLYHNPHTIILFIIFTLSLTIVSAQSTTIKGKVTDRETNESIPFANVIIWQTNTGSTTDIDGFFELKTEQSGYLRLAVSSVGYEKKVSDDFFVTPARNNYIEIKLQQSQINLEEVVIEAAPFEKRIESPTSLRSLGISEIERAPGANRDISKVIQNLPGVGTSVSFRNDLIVRGGGPSENRFYLDGIEIPNINHFATQGASGGPVGIINTDFVRTIDFYSSAFPSFAGNALSSVLDIKQIEGNPERINLRATIGASDMGVTLDGPITPNTTMIISARRSYLQLIFSAIGLPFLPTYNDLQLKVKTKIDLKNEITLIGLGALDQFRLNTEIENPDESQKYILNYLPVNEQWSYTSGVAYKHIDKKGYTRVVVSRNHLFNTSYKYFNNDESSTYNLLLDYNSDEIENKLRIDHVSNYGKIKLSYGTGVEQAIFTTDLYNKDFINGQLVEFDNQTELKFLKWGLFSQISRKFLKDQLSTSFGIRMDANTYSDIMSNPLEQISPRFSLSYAINPKFSINASAGRFFQLPSYTTLGYRNSFNDLINKQNGISYIHADHVVGGIEYLPNRNSKLTVEGFYKTYGKYPFSVLDGVAISAKSADFGTFGDEEVTSTGTGHSYGMELYFREKDFKKFNIILSYTLVRSEFEDRNENYIPTSWDNKHILNVTVSRRFNGNWDAGLKWRFVGGAPYTPYDIATSSNIEAWNIRNQGYLDYSKFNTLRLNNFHQLDIRIDKQFFYKSWSLMLYLDIQNLYNFKAKQADFLTNLDENGIPLIDAANPGNYKLRTIQSEGGTVLPTIGIMIEI